MIVSAIGKTWVIALARRDRQDDGQQEDRPMIPEIATDTDAARRLAPRVDRLLAERARGVEPIDDEEGHEHPQREGRQVTTAPSPPPCRPYRSESRASCVGEEQQDECEHQHPEDFSSDADVVERRQEPHAISVDQGRDDQGG